MDSKNTNHFLSLIIPAYRQEDVIIKNLRAVSRVLNKIRYDYEIIVVIDGIVDESHHKIKEINKYRLNSRLNILLAKPSAIFAEIEDPDRLP
jgi:glycosyltransferase involved in cell wall biosynthesis